MKLTSFVERDPKYKYETGNNTFILLRCGTPYLKHSIWHAKVKVKLSLCLNKHHAMKACWGSGGIAPRIL
jgi:hypothetical protein